jgi:antitoxin CptB
MSTHSETMSRLRWRCRRGMLELDLLLQGFVDGHYALLDEGEQGLFIQLLELTDQELFDYLIASKEPEKKEFSRVIAKIRHAATSQN